MAVDVVDQDIFVTLTAKFQVDMVIQFKAAEVPEVIQETVVPEDLGVVLELIVDLTMEYPVAVAVAPAELDIQDIFIVVVPLVTIGNNWQDTAVEV
jgi:hypothetical protein